VVKIGDHLLGCDEFAPVHGGGDLRFATQTVVARRDFMAPLVRVALGNGYKTIVSSNHPFWSTHDGLEWKWTRAEAIHTGDYVRCVPLWGSHGVEDVDRVSAVLRVENIGHGRVVGLETSPDHTLIADGIVGHNTNDATKRALAQVGNMVFLRGQGVIRSELLYEEMKICVDLGPRWAARGGRSDRVIAWMIAMMGAYLEFEGGNVANIASDRPRDLHAEVDDRDPATHDVGWQKILEPEPTAMSIYEREDLQER
jgi:hypothetical protein